MHGRTSIVVPFIILHARQEFHITIVVVIEAQPERPLRLERMLMNCKLPLAGVFRKNQKRKSGRREVVERQQNIHVTILVEVIAMDVRHVQVLHQRLFLETVTAQVRTGVHTFSFRIIIDVVGNTITVQVLHGQLARLWRGHETVVAHVIENRARPYQIHIAVTVHIDGLREFVTFIYRRASANEHPVTQRWQVADIEFSVSFLCLTSHQ